jgi:hypothetical protein
MEQVMRVPSKFSRVVVLSMVAACSNGGESDVQRTSSALTMPDTGFIPYPIGYGSAHSPVPAWDGSVVDLMAADALAECGRGTTAVNNDGFFADEYLALLRSKMSTAMCPGVQTLTGSTVDRWAYQRTSLADCNLDLTTQAPATVAFVSRDRSKYTLPSLSSLGLTLASGVTEKSVLDHAQTALDIADINLCMAQRLRESMNTADVLVASAEDQALLLSTIRERAQIAMIQYGLLGMVFASTEGTTNAISHPLQYLPVLRAWAASPADVVRPAMLQLGADFAAAIELHADTTEEFGRALQRTARAGSTVAGHNWGDSAGRVRLERLLYGGDPMTDYGASGLALTDGRDAEIGVLLGLARQADALYIRINGSPYEEKPAVDETPTVDRIYRTVEAYIRTHDCQLARPGDTTCVIAWDNAAIPTPANYQNSLLWKRYHVAPNHAATLARMVREAMPGNSSDVGRWHFMGKHSSQLENPGPGTVYGWLHVDPKFATVPVVLGAREALALDYRLHVPSALSLYLNPREQGFVADWAGYGTRSATGATAGDGALSMRRAGAVPALAAARSAIYLGRASTNAGAQAFYTAIPNALKLIEAAIGRRSFAVRPAPANVQITTTGAEDCRSWADPTPPTQCRILIANGLSGTYPLNFEVITEASDPFIGIAWGDYRGPEQVAAALNPSYVSFGNLNQQQMVGDFTTNGSPAGTPDALGNGLERRTYSGRIAPSNKALYFTQKRNDVTTYQPMLVRTQRALAYLSSRYSQNFDSQFFGTGGALNQMALHAWSVHPLNWSLPRYDDFGVPVDWVPPVDPALSGNESTGNAIPYYLSNAKTAAEEATLAISGAIQGLLAESGDVAALESSRRRSTQVNDQEKVALCGNMNCPINTLTVVTLPTFACSGLSTEQTTKCNEAMGWAQQVMRPVLIGGPLKQALDENPPNGPSYVMPIDWYISPYAGSRIFTLFTHQANAVNQVYAALRNLYSTAIAAADNVVAGQAALDSLNSAKARLCGSWEFNAARLTSFSMSGYTAYDSVGVNEGGIWWPQQDVDSVSFTPATLLAAYNACWSAKESLPPAEKNAAMVVSNVNMQLGIQLSQLVSAMATLTQSSADIRQAFSDLGIVQARNDLDQTLAEYNVTTRFGATRRFHHYDLWRARALLDNARRLAATARRAIESRFVVDLSLLNAAEPFVAAPATWADDIYGPDLDLPSALGLSLQSGTADTAIAARNGAVYTQKVLDYVNNLDLFVQGYSVARPTTAAFSESEVVSVVGPDQVEATTCVTPGSVCTTPASCLHVERMVTSGDTTSDQHIRPYMRIVNSGTSSVKLSDLTLRYWFTVDSTASPELQLWCDWATVGCDQINRAVRTISPALTGADRYIELTFNSTAVLAAGAYTEIQIRLNRADWGNFDETNDFSYVASSNYTAANKIGLYKAGFLVWGSEPSGGSSPGCVSGQQATQLSPQAGLWDFYCPTTNTWVKHPSLGKIPVTDRANTVCSGGPPAQIRVSFTLDPWGRLFGEIPDEPYHARHNVRWKRAAVNLVGTGIRDCAKAVNPTACYTESFVRYDLAHGGRAWVTDYDQRWRTLGLPTTLVEGGKALATEEWLDPISHGWNLPMVGAVARWELTSRPLGGDYTLTFDVSPDLRLDRIEQVQILTESDYWARQD